MFLAVAHTRAMAGPDFGIQRIPPALSVDQFNCDFISGAEAIQRFDEHQVQPAGLQSDSLSGLDDQFLEAAHAHHTIVHDHGVDFYMTELRAVRINQDDGSIA